MDDSPQPAPEPEDYDLDDGMALDEVRALEERGVRAYREGRVIPHERMLPWFDGLARAVERGEPLPPRPATEAELAAKRDQNH